MRTAEEVLKEIEAKQEAITGLKAKLSENEAEIKRIREQNTQWLAENTDRSRMPASLATRRDGAAKLAGENEELAATIKILEGQLQDLELEAVCAQHYGALAGTKERIQKREEARSMLRKKFEAMFDAMNEFIGAAEEDVKAGRALEPLIAPAKALGGTVCLRTLAERGEIVLDPSNNREWLSELVDQTYRFLNSKLELTILQNVLRNIDDPVVVSHMRQTLWAALPQTRSGQMERPALRQRPDEGIRRTIRMREDEPYHASHVKWHQEIQKTRNAEIVAV